MAFALLAVPLAQLTGSFSDASTNELNQQLAKSSGKEAVQGSTEHPEGEHVHEQVAAIVRVRFAHRPLTVSLRQENKEILPKLDLSQSPIEAEAKLEISHEGDEFIATATWPEGTPETALTVEIEPEGFDTQTQTRWTSEGRLDEVLTFQW